MTISVFPVRRHYWLWTCAEPSSEIGIGLSTSQKMSCRVWKCQNMCSFATKLSVRDMLVHMETARLQLSLYGYEGELLDLYILWDVGPFIWTWPESQTVMWIVSPVITVSVWISTGTWSAGSHVQCRLWLQRFPIAHVLPGMAVNIACCLIGRTVTDWFNRWNFQVLERSLYSPNVRLCDSDIF
jgi:hypothetical protein